MAISGRVPLLLLLGLVPVVLRPTMGTMWLWFLVVSVTVGLDWLLAPRPEALTFERRPLAVRADGPPDLDDAGRGELVAAYRPWRRP